MANFEGMFNKKSDEAKTGQQHPRRETKWIHYSKLTDNAKQYRDSTSEEDVKNLAALIQADGGVLQNLLVRKIDTDEYEIIAGHHRKAACKYLVEEADAPEFAFLPCTVTASDDVKAEFALYSSNGFMPKSDYERMHELTRMRELIEQYPDKFPHLNKGRIVERLAQQMHMGKTAVGEYLTIDKHLGTAAMEAFASGELNKSAAVELASLSEDEQDDLLDHGITSRKDIKAYRDSKQKKTTETHRVTVTESKICREEEQAYPYGKNETYRNSVQDDLMNPPVEEPSEEEQEEIAPGDATAEYFLYKERDVLNRMLQSREEGQPIREIDLLRQKYIVIALTRYVMEEGVQNELQ